MYVNAKMISVEIIPGIGDRREIIVVVEGVNSSMMYLVHCKNLCKWPNVHPPSTTIQEKK
jgi:hypothetical protein